MKIILANIAVNLILVRSLCKSVQNESRPLAARPLTGVAPDAARGHRVPIRSWPRSVSFSGRTPHIACCFARRVRRFVSLPTPNPAPLLPKSAKRLVARRCRSEGKSPPAVLHPPCTLSSGPTPIFLVRFIHQRPGDFPASGQANTCAPATHARANAPNINILRLTVGRRATKPSPYEVPVVRALKARRPEKIAYPFHG